MLRIPILVGLTLLYFVPPALSAEPRQDKDDLTREIAEFRRAQIESVAYQLHFTLTETSDHFEGVADLQIQLRQTDAPLSIDLLADRIHRVSVNGTPVTNLAKRKGSFDIPPAYLSSDPMTITVTYRGNYAGARDGLCRYTDPVDDRTYLYTNLEPYGAHYVFPCFDQPDIKATYTMTVDAPGDWVVIGNMPPESTDTKGKTATTTFKSTPPLSTYLFFLGAGDYQVWRDEHEGLPLALYARASLATYFDTERLFAETKAGLDYFNTYFKTPYPFEKYDHIFAPELGPGAMENPGAVTMNEFMIFRATPTQRDYRRRNYILLHEMAHMWFGNLVTMAWWNDLWLNESFATFSAYQAQDAIGTYDGIWETFYQSKGWAYNQDQLSTTHPIEVYVPTAQLATANFDGITYAKGASALKQLWFAVGEKAYQNGVVDYFRKHAWQNATRAQFMAAISAQTHTNLEEWTHRWIQTEGLSTMHVEYTCDDGLLGSFRMQQSTLNAPTLSPHRTQIGLFHFDDRGKLVLSESVPASFYESTTSIDTLSGKPCPDFVYPNVDDMDYGLYFLDERSYATAMKHLSALEDPFMRRMVWGTLFSMVRHQKLQASTFMDILLRNLPRETDLDMVEYLLEYRPTREVFQRYLAPETALRYAPKLERLLWDGLQSAAPGTDAWLNWFDAYVAMTIRTEDKPKLRTLLESTPGQPDLDQPRRWQVVRKLAALGAPDTEALVRAELANDPTDQGQRYAFSARGAVPDPITKHKQWEQLKKTDLSLTLLRSGASTFHNDLHPELSAVFVDDWFDYVRSRDWEAEQHRISLWFDELMPPVYTPEFLARSRETLEKTALPARARRAWQESNDYIERVIAIRAYDRATD